MEKNSTIFALRNRLHFVQSCDTFDNLSCIICRSQQHLEGEKNASNRHHNEQPTTLFNRACYIYAIKKIF